MKKALVVFLILAVAGGLFAQVSYSGSVFTGFGIGITDAEGGVDGATTIAADEPLVDYIRNRGETGLRADLNFAYKGGVDDDHPNGVWGANLGFRADVGRFAASTYALSPQAGNIWWNPNAFFFLNIGDGGGRNDYGTPGSIGAKWNIQDNNGLKIELRPLGDTSLRIAGHLFYGKANAKLFESMDYGLGVRYDISGLLSAVANARYYPYGTISKTTDATSFDLPYVDEDAKFNLGAGLNYLGLTNVGLTRLAADVGVNNFGGDFSYIGFGPAVEFKALANALTLGANFQYYIWTGEETRDFSPMRIHGEVSYNVNSTVTFALQGRYVMGRGPLANSSNGWSWRNAGEGPGINVQKETWDKDAASLYISPVLTFKVGPTINVGYNLLMDMSKNATNTGRSVTSAPGATTITYEKNKTMQHLIYATVEVSF